MENNVVELLMLAVNSIVALILILSSVSSMIESNNEVVKIGKISYYVTSVIGWLSLLTVWLNQFNDLYSAKYAALKKAKKLTKEELKSHTLLGDHLSKVYNSSLEYMDTVLPKLIMLIAAALLIMILMIIITRVINAVLKKKSTFLPSIDAATFAYMKKNVWRLLFKLIGAIVVFLYMLT